MDKLPIYNKIIMYKLNFQQLLYVKMLHLVFLQSEIFMKKYGM